MPEDTEPRRLLINSTCYAIPARPRKRSHVQSVTKTGLLILRATILGPPRQNALPIFDKPNTTNTADQKPRPPNAIGLPHLLRSHAIAN